MGFKSDWICILTAGATVDGREVTDTMVDDMAAGYDPNLYNARINIDHSNWGYKLGSVESLKAEVVDGVKKLFAVIRPNDYLLSLVQAGQKLHTSAEIQPNFAGTGKYYLTGLAVTDSPASLGTTELKLSKDSAAVMTLSTGEPFDMDVKPANVFMKFFSKEPQPMDKETAALLSQMNQQLSQTATIQEQIVTKLAAISAKAPEQTQEQQTDLPNNEGVVELKSQVQALSEQVTALTKAIESIDAGTQRNQADGKNSDTDDLGAL